MATPKQIAAARANGAKSKGPVSAQGKKNSSRNNLRHGGFARTIHLEGALQQQFQQFLTAYREDCRPKSEPEAVLVNQLALCRVQQYRLAAAQTLIWNREYARQKSLAPNDSHEFLMASTFCVLNRKIRASAVLFSLEMRYVRLYFKALDRLAKIQHERKARTEYEPTNLLIPKQAPSSIDNAPQIRYKEEDDHTPRTSSSLGEVSGSVMRPGQPNQR